ncbi:MAG: hypothetical protein AAF715_31675, partial [Myxococcota bacterium]
TPEDATVTIDGAPPEFNDQGIAYVKPGPHDVAVTKNGFAPETQSITTKPGDEGAVSRLKDEIPGSRNPFHCSRTSAPSSRDAPPLRRGPANDALRGEGAPSSGG